MKQFCRLVKTHTFLNCLVLAAVLLASIIIGIGTGPVAIPFAEVWRVMFHRLGGLLTGMCGCLAAGLLWQAGGQPLYQYLQQLYRVCFSLPIRKGWVRD